MLFYGTTLIMKEKSNASALGCRDERRWDGVQLCLLLRALTVVRTGFTEVRFYQWQTAAKLKT